jgi:type IV secretion system protein VirD4
MQQDPDVKRLYSRLYDRSDLGNYRGQTIAGLIIAGVWLFFGLINYQFLADSIPKDQRKIVAFGYGPAFVPLNVAKTGPKVEIAGLGVPVRAGALLGALPLGLAGLLIVGNQTERSQRDRQRRKAQQYAAAQGRPLPAEVIKKTALKGAGVPLGLVQAHPIGIPYKADKGHVAVVAPTRSGKGLHLTETLLSWPGPCVVLDPKSEQWERTVGYRSRYGPIYRLPELSCINLLDYFDMSSSLDVQELHGHLMRPWQDSEKIFSEKSLALFQAAATAGRATGRHPLHLLARWARMAAPEALIEARRYAKAEIDQFLDGDDPGQGINRFTQSAWGTFTTRFGPFVPYINTVSTSEIPRTWQEENATIYITYPLDQLQTAGPLVSAILAALIKGQMRQHKKQHVLYAIDEMPTVALYNLDTYLATVGGYGATMLLYMQSLAQLNEVYGHHRAQSVLSNCHHQLYYPPRDPETARHISEMFGTELQFTKTESYSGSGQDQRVSATYNESQRPALDTPEALALPESAVVVFTTLAGRQYRILTERMNPIAKLDTLPKLGIHRGTLAPQADLSPLPPPPGAEPATTPAPAPRPEEPAPDPAEPMPEEPQEEVFF